MFFTLLKHSWKRTFRSPAFTQQLVQTIFLGFLFVYFALSFLALGFILGKVIKEKYPDENVIFFIGGYLVYYFLFDLLARIMIQKYPVLDIKKYLTLPVREKDIIHFYLVKSLTSFFNYLPLFAIVPFIIANYQDMISQDVLLSFSLIIIGRILLNNYLGMYLDKFMRKNNVLVYGLIGALLIILLLDSRGYIGLLPLFRSNFAFFISSPFLAVMPLLVAIALYYLNYQFLSKNLYIEDLETEEISEADNLNLGFLERFGRAGKLMNLEIKLIWRNRRSRMGVIMALIFLLYPLIFINNPTMEFVWFKMFLGLFISGFFALNYGQLMLSWNSTHFDLLATRNIRIIEIFKAKYYIMAFSVVVLGIVSLAYGFLDISFIRIVFVMMLFNAGVTIFLYMLLASINSKRIDPSKGAVMNYEGIGIAHFLIIFPIMFLPGLIYWPFAAHGHPDMGEWVVGIIGLIGIIFHNQIINMCTAIFMKNRYKIMAAFRKKQ